MIAWGRIEGETCHKESQTFFYFPFSEIASNFRYFCEKCRNNVHLTVKITINHNSTFTHSHIVGGEVCVCVLTHLTPSDRGENSDEGLCAQIRRKRMFSKHPREKSPGAFPRSMPWSEAIY